MIGRSRYRVACCVSGPASEHRGSPAKRWPAECLDPPGQSTMVDWEHTGKGIHLYGLSRAECLQLDLMDRNKDIKYSVPTASES